MPGSILVWTVHVDNKELDRNPDRFNDIAEVNSRFAYVTNIV